MKYFLLVGGFLGFVAGFGGGMLGGERPSGALFTGVGACLMGAILFRGFHFVFGRAVRAHLEIRAAQSTPPDSTSPKS